MNRQTVRQSGVTAALILITCLLAADPAAAGDAAKGKGVFNAQCGICHTANKGGPAILGPNLYGVVGRKAGSVAGYNYSPGMKNAGFAWSDDKLNAYLPGPRAMVAGTKMTYGGLKDSAKLADLVAYLDTLK
jgi:cytochrome c